VILSVRAKESFKTALAITIAMGIALWMDWEKPYWAGFAVALISLPMEGQSLNQGAMRMLGTLVASAVAHPFRCDTRWRGLAGRHHGFGAGDDRDGGKR